MNVLIIPEDFRKDQFVLQPILGAMLQSAGRSKAKIRVCQDPLLGGVVQATKWQRVEEILLRYRGMVDLFLLCVDRDGDSGRKSALATLEERAAGVLGTDRARIMLAENAWQEIEVWVLAGHELPSGWNWRDVRAEINPKEVYFLPFARSRGVHDQPADGRKQLASEAAKRYARIRRRCPEDVEDLEQRVRAWLKSHP